MNRAGGLAGALLLAAIFLFGAIRAPLLTVPLERDEGEYAYIAQRMLEGDVPYRDAFDQKPPGVFAAYAAAFVVLGESALAIRIFASLWALSTLLCVAGLARAVAGPVAGGAAALLFSVSISVPSVFGFTANTELFVLLPATGSIWLTIRALRATGSEPVVWALASALATAAFAFKQVAAVQWLLVAAAAAWHVHRQIPEDRVRLAVRTGSALVLGSLAVIAPIVLVFAASGGLAALVDAVFLHNLEYTGVVQWQAGLEKLRDALSSQTPTFAVQWALAMIALGFTGVLAPSVRILLAGWWLASFAAISLGLNFRLHYFILWLPVIAVLAGAALAEGWASLHRRGSLERAGFVLVAVALALAPPLLDARAVVLAESDAARSHILYGRNPFADSRAIAQHIRDGSEPDDTVFIMGSEPQILFYADRVSASRYIFTYPLLGAFASAPLRQHETVKSVEAARPLYLVWVRIPTSQLAAPTPHWLLPKALGRWIQNDYTLDAIWVPLEDSFGFQAYRGDAATDWMDANPDSALNEVSVQVFRRRDAAVRRDDGQAASDGGIPTM